MINSPMYKRIFSGLLVLCAVFCVWGFRVHKDDAQKIKTIVIDAGHGGKDPGNLGTGRFKKTEKDVSLDVAKLLGGYIEANFSDIKVIYTRKDDTFLELFERTELANKVEADLFISIHCNSNDNKSAYGTETFVMGLHKTTSSLKTAMKENASIYLEEDHETRYGGLDPKNPDTYIQLSLRNNYFLGQSISLSKKIQDQFRTRVSRRDRGVKQAGFYVVSYTNMPSVLVELGFLTNHKEEDFLQSKNGKEYMASAIYRAFKEYKSEVENQPTAEEIVIEEIPVEVKPEPAQTVEKEVDHPKRVNLNKLLTTETTENETFFAVQVMSASEPVDKTPDNFLGIEKVDEYISNGLYKYAVGKTLNFKKAKANQRILRKNGYPEAFVVAFKAGDRVSISEAMAELDKK